MKKATITQIQDFLKANYSHLTYNDRIFVVEYPNGQELKTQDYSTIALEGTLSLNVKVSAVMTKMILNSGWLPKSPARVSPFWIHPDQYQLLDGRPVALLHRKENAQRTDNCPFCGKTHAHGNAPGHRSPHCVTIVGYKQGKLGRYEVTIRKQILATDGTLLSYDDGYILKIYESNETTSPTPNLAYANLL